MNVLESLRYAFGRAREVQPGFSESMSEEVLTQILAVLGGQQVTVPRTKTGKPGRPGTPPAVLQRAYLDGLSTSSSREVVERQGISRATLYRLMKKGPPDGGEQS